MARRFNPHARECWAGGVRHGNARIQDRCRDCRDVRAGRAPNVVAETTRKGWPEGTTLIDVKVACGNDPTIVFGAQPSRPPVRRDPATRGATGN